MLVLTVKLSPVMKPKSSTSDCLNKKLCGFGINCARHLPFYLIKLFVKFSKVLHKSSAFLSGQTVHL